MQNWQFYLHMLAMCVIILLLYLFFREYKSRKTQAPASGVAASSRALPVPMPLSHAHIQAMQSLTTGSVAPAPASHRFETESNLDRELSAEINDLGRIPSSVDDANSETGSSASGASQGPIPTGSPMRQVIEFVPKKATKRKSKVEA